MADEEMIDTTTTIPISAPEEDYDPWTSVPNEDTFTSVRLCFIWQVQQRARKSFECGGKAVFRVCVPRKW